MKRNRLYPAALSALFFIILFFPSERLFPAVQFTVEGLEGISFEEQAGDYQLTVSSPFTLHGMKVIPSGLVLLYRNADKSFKITGSAALILDKDTLSISLGDSSSPGILIRSRLLLNVGIGISGGFHLNKLHLSPVNLFFAWNRQGYQYKIYGDLNLKLEDQTISAHLGNAENPGIRIDSGKIHYLNFGLTGNLKIRSLLLKSEGLSLTWAKDSSFYKMYGDISVLLQKDTLMAGLGTLEKPGLIVKDGTVKKFEISLTGVLSIRKLSIRPKALAFSWDEQLKRIQIFGSASVYIGSDTLDALLGNSENPGIEITNGIVQKIDIKVNADFKLKSLAIKPDSLTFIYDKTADFYKMYGAVELDIEKDTVKAFLGTEANPGLIISGGKIEHIFLQVTSRFRLKKLAIDTDSLGIEWQRDALGNTFHFFGKVKIDIDTSKIGFDFGNSIHPGLIFRNGSIDSLKISTTSDIYFAGFEAATQALTLEYSGGLYHLYGKVFLKKMWSAQIDLGSGPGSGVTLDLKGSKPKLKIDKANFELADIDLGPVTLKDLTLSLEQNRVQSAALTLDLPPGWEIAAGMTFGFVNNKLHIDSVGISWEALKFEEAIEIPGTGAFIVKLKGGLSGIEDPHQFKVSGEMDIALGGPFNIKGIGEVSLLYLHARAVITRSELIIDSDALMGAYKKDGTWVSVLGDGHIKLDFKWGDYYSLDGSLNIPSDPYTILRADLQAKLSAAGALNAHVGVHLIVPKKIPVAGGHEFAQAEGAVHYDKSDPSSYAAGWANLNLGFYNWKGGIKYNFRSKDYTALGSKEISSLSVAANGQASSGSIKYIDYRTITVNSGDNPNFIQVKVRFKQKLNTFYLDVRQSFFVNNSCFSPFYLVAGIDQMTQSGISLSTIPSYISTQVNNTDSIIFYIMPPGYKTNARAALPSGNYYVEISNLIGSSMIQDFEVHRIYNAPYSGWSYFYVNVVNSSSQWLLRHKLNYHTDVQVYNIDSARVNLFYTKSRNQSGTLIKTLRYSDYWGNYPPDGVYLKIEGIDFPQDIMQSDSLYLYLTVDDGINALFKSPVQSVSFLPKFQAQVRIKGMPDSLCSGIETQLYVRNLADNSLSPADNIKRFTNNKGVAAFPYYFPFQSIIKCQFDIPAGYETDPNSPYQNGQEIRILPPLPDKGLTITLLLRKKQDGGGSYVR